MPEFYLFGGPNGAGKTTSAMRILPTLRCRHFLNADMLAQGFSPLDVDLAAFKAGIALMRELRAFAAKGEDFGTESTLAARAYIPLVERWRAQGYRFHLYYVWLPSADMAVERVAARVRAGGHNIPEDVIRRRYEKGRRNFVEFYAPRADFWTVIDNSKPGYKIAAEGGLACDEQIFDASVWEKIHV